MTSVSRGRPGTLPALMVAACLAASGVTSAQQSGLPESGVGVLHVQRSVSLLVVDGGNIAVQSGPDGVLLVDARTAALAPRVISAIRTLSNEPIHTIISTHVHADHTGGNEALVKMRGTGATQPVRVLAQDNVLRRLLDQAAESNTPVTGFRLNAAVTLPINNTYDTPSRDFYLNGEAIVVHHVPAAHTDGDSLVYFRGSDVLAVGDVFDPERYPFIDLDNGGSVQGLIAALNRVLEITIPARYQEGGTYVIPGHGRLCDEADVVEYRDMVTIVRDRIQDLIGKGLTVQQVLAARPSRDYDPHYGTAAAGRGAPDGFVEAVFRSLTK